MPENFISSVEEFLSPEECQVYIDYFEKLKTLNLTVNRQRSGEGFAHHRNDEAAFLMQNEILVRIDNPLNNSFLDKFWKFYELYSERYSILHETQKHTIYSIKIQKTLPGQGYHVWHFESHQKINAGRILAFTVFLNDVNEGGETEFLYQQLRVKPTAGKLLIWPAGFTHTHRGNPPISDIKYILTGWVEFA